MLSVADIPIAGKHLFGLFREIWFGKKVLRDAEYMMSNYQNLKLYIPDGKVKLILLI